MEPTLPLRNKIRFERRPQARDGLGGYEYTFASLGERLAKLTPTRGGEEVIAARLTGVSSWDCWVRYDAVTKALTPGDRAVEIIGDGEGREFNIRFCQDMTGRRRWLFLQLELGGPSG